MVYYCGRISTIRSPHTRHDSMREFENLQPRKLVIHKGKLLCALFGGAAIAKQSTYVMLIQKPGGHSLLEAGSARGHHSYAAGKADVIIECSDLPGELLEPVRRVLSMSELTPEKIAEAGIKGFTIIVADA